MHSNEVQPGALHAPARPLQASPRSVDARALERIRQRLRAAPGAPWLHGEVARRMAERLPLMKARPEWVVDWQPRMGGGEAALRAAYPSARVVAVDAMADPSLVPPARWGLNWSTLRATARALWVSSSQEVDPQSLMPGRAGLLWANMVLHAHPDPLALFSQWHRAMAVDGFLMFSTLGPATLAELRAVYAEAGWGSPMAPQVDMHDLGDMLVEAGFADPVMDQEQIVLTWPDAGAALRELRTLGGNADVQRYRGCRTPRWRARLEQALQARAARRPDGRVALTFEVAYGHAFKAPPRAQLASETRVDVEQMRQMLSSSRGRRS